MERSFLIIKNQKLNYFFQEWFLIYKSTNYYKLSLFNKREQYFYNLLYFRRRQRTNKGIIRAHSYYIFSLLRRGFRKFQSYPENSRRLLKEERKKRRALSYYHQILLKRVFQSFKSYVQQNHKIKQLDQEHQSRRNKIQNFISNLKSSKEPQSKHNSQNTQQFNQNFYHNQQIDLSISSSNSSPPPSYCFNDPSSPIPISQELNLKPQPFPQSQSQFQSQSQSQIKSTDNSRYNQKQTNHSKISENNVKTRNSQPSSIKNTIERPKSATRLGLRRQSGGEVLENNSLSRRNVDSDKLSVSSQNSLRSKSATRNSIRSKTINPPSFQSQTSPSQSSSLSTSTNEVKPNNRKEKMKSLEEAAKARIQSKKSQEDEMRRLKELEDEQKYQQEIMEYKKQLASQKRFSNSKPIKLISPENDQKLLSKALTFYRTNLLIKYGFGPWNILVEERRLDWEKAIRFYSDSLLQKYYYLFKGYVINLKKEKYRLEFRKSTLALSHYKRNLLQLVFKSWKSYRKIIRAKFTAVSIQILSFGRCRKAFKAWRVSYERFRRKEARQLAAIDYKVKVNLLKRCFIRWKDYLQEIEFEKEIDERVDATWARVQKWLI